MAEACYIDRYLPASFRFIPFTALDITSEHGRRGAEGEFPFGEQTAYADLGRKIRKYSISARLATNEHIAIAALLIAACELPGPGILTHPTRGIIRAACTRLVVTDDVEKEGGVTYLEMDFVEANEWPNGFSFLGQILGLVIGTIINSSRSNFSSNYNPKAVQPFRREAVIGAAQAQVASINTEYQLATVPGEARNRYVYDLESLATDDKMASSITTMDRGLAVGMQLLAANLTETAKFNAFRRIANGAARQSSFAAPAGDAENAIYSNVRIIAAAYMAQGTYETSSLRSAEIFEQIDAIQTILQGEMAYAGRVCANQLYIDLAQFQSEVTAALYDKAYSAPGFIDFDFSGGVHPLIAAYSIYGDAKRHREVEAINRVSISGRVGPRVVGIR